MSAPTNPSVKFTPSNGKRLVKINKRMHHTPPEIQRGLGK
jgi:hypothetical protein